MYYFNVFSPSGCQYKVKLKQQQNRTTCMILIRAARFAINTTINSKLSGVITRKTVTKSIIRRMNHTATTCQNT